MKNYSKRILTATLALGMCIGMTACGEDKLADETTAETTAVTTTESETTAETTVETTAPETEEEKIGLNADLISEYGQTFAEISAKHGKIVDYLTPHGGDYFEFETGYGTYYFYGTYSFDISTWEPIGNEGKKAPLPGADYKCICIDGIAASDFFNKEFETMTIQEIEDIDGMTLLYDGEAGITSSMQYRTLFSYEGFSHEKTGFTGDKTEIAMFHDEDGIITPDTRVDIDLWGTYADVYLGTTNAEES